MDYKYTFIDKDRFNTKDESYTFYRYENEATRLEVTVFDKPDGRHTGRFMITVKEERDPDEIYANMSDADKYNAVMSKILGNHTPICIGGIFLTDGHQNRITAETVTESHTLAEMKAMNGCWYNISKSVHEADRIARSLIPGSCIIQSEEEVKAGEEEEKEAEKAFDLMLSDFMESKGLPKDYCYKDEEEFETLSAEIEEYMTEWLKEHPDMILP